ncbi:hypothetical protein E4N62_19575 [Streptomyces sp. MNU76]|uniref:hypothetical protein n=1 Tax=Streptomyces sp. MNU76 TaxID=2560026 RepID=UPI001E3BCAF1|nr:hypothetical protein [Streptomyces sp. MNU76]MCC9707282.1 hypothetical protein [Streptomyces sp. MNU76]
MTDSAALVQSSGQIPVGLPRGTEIGPGLLQRGGQFDIVLLQPRDLPLELVDVRWGSEPGLLPCLSSQRLRQPLLQLLDASGQAGVAGLGVGEVGLERGPADR